VLVSVGIWAVTGSVYSLLFAALGPVVALGSLLDGRRHRRRTARREAERSVASLDRVRQRVLEVQERERRRLDLLAPPLRQLCLPDRLAANWAQAHRDVDSVDVAPLPVRLGRARRGPAVIVDGAADPLEQDDELPDSVRDALAELARAAAALDAAAWIVDVCDGIGIVGPAAIARALARSIALQWAANCSPVTGRVAVTVGPTGDEAWLSALPHPTTQASVAEGRTLYRLTDRGREVLIACVRDRSELPPGVSVVVDVSPEAPERTARHERFELVGAARARDEATALASLAAERGMLSADHLLPEAVSLAEVLCASPAPSRDGRTDGRTDGLTVGLGAPVGRDAAGVVELDLVRDGPHAVVAGTTGAGKSELLVSWVLAMATRHPPTAVTFLLVDFKGGAAFAPLAGLPHVIGTVSDLDTGRSARAIESLRAELQRRERVLAACGARSIDELEAQAPVASGARLARLVIVVDEFAAVVSGQPELHELFADISGRGRSLGLHLILCTQRPSGVVRDAVLANVTLRISLRVTDRGDSLAMLGSDAATRLAPAVRGRAMIADGSGQIREVQLALADPDDAERLRSTDPGPVETMWCDPLPERLPLDTLQREAAREGGVGIPFGRVDLPAQQSQPIARHDPRGDGHLLVLGSARSGRTTVLSTLAAGAADAGVSCVVVPDVAAEASSLLSELLERSAAEKPDATLVLFDDLDLLLARRDPDERHELIELVTRVMRGPRRLSLVVTAQRLSGGLQGLAGLFDGRVLLRHPSRDEYVLSGGDGATFDPRVPPGGGRWMGSRGGGAVIQVATGSAPLPTARLVTLPVVGPAGSRPLAVVCPRPAQLANDLAGAGARVFLLGEAPVPDESELRVSRGADPVVLVGDPDDWQAQWALLSFARRELPIAVLGCAASELRAITRARDAPPPLGDRPGECWWVEEGVVRRALLRLTRPS